MTTCPTKWRKCTFIAALTVWITYTVESCPHMIKFPSNTTRLYCCRQTCSPTVHIQPICLIAYTDVQKHFNLVISKTIVLRRWNVSGGLKMLHEAFTFYVAALEKRFASLFSTNSILPSCGRYIKAALVTVSIPAYRTPVPCVQFPQDYLFYLFVRTRIFYSVKIINHSYNIKYQTSKMSNLTHNVDMVVNFI